MYRHLQAVCCTIGTDEVLKWASAHAPREQRQWLSNQGLGVRSTFCFVIWIWIWIWMLEMITYEHLFSRRSISYITNLTLTSSSTRRRSGPTLPSPQPALQFKASDIKHIDKTIRLSRRGVSRCVFYHMKLSGPTSTVSCLSPEFHNKLFSRYRGYITRSS